MSPAEAHAYLSTLAPSTIRMGLDRITRALSLLGDPQRRFRAIHVAGTNGKGSTCAVLASCLGQAVRVGFYSSPHLVRVNERFKVDGEDISDEVLARRIDEVLLRLGRDHELTYFEFGTALAFWHFAQEAVEVAVIETGLGGRLDATVLCEPVVTAITSISFDHMEFLGDTLPAIAGEKAGIVKPGVPLVVARQPDEVLAVFDEAARRAGSSLIVEGRDVSLVGDRFEGRALRVDGVRLPLAGPHQLQNVAVALGCLEVLAARGGPALTESQLRAGVADTRWPGRFEVLEGPCTVVLDGAHNPAGVEALIATLEERFPGRAFTLVFGVFADKDSEPMMRRLFPRAATLHLTPLLSPRSRPVDGYLPLAERLCAQVTKHESVERALRAAIDGTPGGLVVVAGSLHLVGEAREALEHDSHALVRALERFTPGDDPDRTMAELAALLPGGWPALEPVRFRRAVIALLERFPDAEFGTPGALVHEIERRGGYQRDLAASLARQPTFLTVSMVNRLMNLTDDEETLARARALLDAAITHPKTPDWVRTAAQRYRAHHEDR